MDIKDDSRKIKEGEIFVAIDNGYKYINEALNNGASKIITDNDKIEKVTDIRDYTNNYLKEKYYEQIKKLKIIGMTGTNGKTTTCFLIHKALNNLGVKSAYIGTIGFYINDKIKDLKNTTPDIIEIYELLLECINMNVEYVVMEVSSHALALKRVETLLFDYAIFSNLTIDHLDYHKTMDEYCKTKQKLFKMLKKDGKAIINIDDKYSSKFLLKENKNVTYGENKSNYMLTSYNMQLTGMTFNIMIDGQEHTFKTTLIGKYNLYNIICVIIVLNQIGFNMVDIKETILNLKAPIGRMDIIRKNNNIIIIDYAHTPDAVSNILTTVKELNPNHIYTIIGCGGNRDKSKRPKMANIACQMSTKVIFTSDNPRFEKPSEIIDDMVNGLNSSNYEIVVNRKKAIIRGIQMLKKSDILLVLGKGHENYQIINGEKIYFDDKKIVIDNI